MTVPKSIEIGASVWAVTIDATIDELGTTTPRRTEIKVNPNQSPASMRDTVLHELLHAVCSESGMSHAMGVSDDDEERMIRILTPMLLQVLRRNPRLHTYLTTT